MTAQVRRNLAELSKVAKKNAPIVRQRLKEAGKKPSAGLVESASRYYDALKKLASE